jgi:hypothetical protein
MRSYGKDVAENRVFLVGNYMVSLIYISCDFTRKC